ncbi:hypothetical protein A6R68_02667 [Neotoma lepida]|uniref:PID domain-containing protein n=1 Tax=Neotoma lepida TaxID=56216 RepID=A0A1A6GT00_NEOLE|nr:hypothetical protein A6R68_02667 [Neotoma lepida]
MDDFNESGVGISSVGAQLHRLACLLIPETPLDTPFAKSLSMFLAPFVRQLGDRLPHFTLGQSQNQDRYRPQSIRPVSVPFVQAFTASYCEVSYTHLDVYKRQTPEVKQVSGIAAGVGNAHQLGLHLLQLKGTREKQYLYIVTIANYNRFPTPLLTPRDPCQKYFQKLTWQLMRADSGVDTLAVFMASSGTTDVANRNSPATPPNTLNLRSSHNELLNAEIKHSDAKNSTPPKCRKKYALTNIQAAMGLSDPAVQPLLGNGSANIKLVKNGENQLRKAAEQGQQDPNKNISPTAVINLTSEKLEVKDLHPPESSGCEILPSQPRRTKSFLNYYADLETSARELGQNLGPCQGVGEEKAQPGPGQAPVVIGNGDLLIQKPDRPQSSPEDGQVATVSSSPETKKDHPKTGAKTDCALHRIQNLAPSDEESSWTTLSQDSASPSSPDETGEDFSAAVHANLFFFGLWFRKETISGVTIHFRRIRIYHLAGKESVTLPGPIIGTSQQERLSGNGLSPSQWTSRDLHAATVNPDPSLKEFEGATLRYASLKLRNAPHADDDDSCSVNSDPEAKCFAVRSLGWVEMAEEDLAPGKSSVAVNNCIRQLSYCKNDIRDTVGIWGEGKDMYLILENDMLSLVDPMDRSVLHSQPIVSIRVWGVGRDNGRVVAKAVSRSKIRQQGATYPVIIIGLLF